jgi:hypothetical protein
MQPFYLGSKKIVQITVKAFGYIVLRILIHYLVERHRIPIDIDSDADVPSDLKHQRIWVTPGLVEETTKSCSSG